MSALLAYLPNSPMVVEGYATEASIGERFILAKRRASLVRSYIGKRFGLQSDMVWHDVDVFSHPPGPREVSLGWCLSRTTP
jgi:hypothetical protein